MVALLIGLLLFILNIFLGLSLYTQEFSTSIKEKLGMYFYITDDVGQNDAVYAKVMQLSKQLQDQGLETTFASKDQAFGFLENKIPNVAENFARFGINNPLPATLYVMFADEKQYESLKSIIVNYKDIIANVTDVDKGMQLKQQETRVVNMINFSSFIVFVSYSLVFLLFVIILSLCGYMLHTLFVDFHGKITVKRMLGASLNQMVHPFMVTTGWVMLCAYALAIVLLLTLSTLFSWYLAPLFNMTVWSIIASYGWVFWAIVLLQFVCLL